MPRNWMHVGLAGLLVTVSMNLSGCTGGSAPAPKPNPSNTAQSESDDAPLPEERPRITEVTLNDATLEDYQKLLKDHEGDVIFVDFWGTWCGNCKDEFPNTVKLHKTYWDAGLTVISVALEFDPKDEATRAAALDFLTQQKATFNNLLYAEDGSTETALAGFKVEPPVLPHYHLYDHTGKLRYQFTFSDPQKPITQHDIQEAVKTLLSEKAP